MDRTVRRILIVDDEPPLLRMMSLFLGRKGYTVTTADGTDQAWALVEADPAAFDIAVLDGSMPGMTMEELATRMLQANPAMCILSASGYLVDISGLAAKAPGRVAFLLKPFTPHALAEAVGGLLGAQEKEL
ncbi:MAG TPA: response regulator [Bryobacteraceae bacterium]|jgi:CheY-like chemotaxis protein|nr:response regulator [Bryobacteraceae bacterium]